MSGGSRDTHQARRRARRGAQRLKTVSPHEVDDEDLGLRGDEGAWNWVWRAICACRELLLIGGRWRWRCPKRVAELDAEEDEYDDNDDDDDDAHEDGDGGEDNGSGDEGEEAETDEEDRATQYNGGGEARRPREQGGEVSGHELRAEEEGDEAKRQRMAWIKHYLLLGDIEKALELGWDGAATPRPRLPRLASLPRPRPTGAPSLALPPSSTDSVD
tara:strand:- start:322 stop:969 length:648 start_codon:yes stop_codon:yes gene_type:complete